MTTDVDLHMHTTISDGRLRPAELVALLARRGLRYAAITDHDCTDGLDEAFDTVKAFPELELVTGVELSTDIPGSEVHVLGYFFDYHNDELQVKLAEFRESRSGRAKKMLQKLAALGMPLAWDRVVKIAGDGAIDRPHIAQAMLEKGYIASSQEAFTKYLGRTGLAYVEREKLTPAEAVQLIVRVGGRAVLAHPGDLPDPEPVLLELKAAGLSGMEVYYGSYGPEKVESLLAICQRHRLIPCGGSDFHGIGNDYEGEPGTVGPPVESLKMLADLASARA